MADFGPQLKQAREQRGISLRQISTTTKISVSVLEALERGDFSRLPGGIFSRSFVRAYAHEVGLDPDRTVAQFAHEYEVHVNSAEEMAAPEVTADDRAFLERQRRAALWLRAILVVILLLGGAAIVAWQVRSRAVSKAPSTQTQETTPTTPAADRATTDAPAPSALPAAVPSPPAASVPSDATSIKPTAPATAAGVAAPVKSTETSAAPADPEQVTVRLETDANCWIKATVDGKVQFQEILHAGDSRELKSGREVVLQVGNAGAVKWAINGRAAKPLGKPGQTVTARVSRDNLDKYAQ
jgi:cytoskeletal protein RodZ